MNHNRTRVHLQDFLSLDVHPNITKGPPKFLFHLLMFPGKKGK